MESAGAGEPPAEAPKRSLTLVLCYHAISESWPAALAVSQESLRRQVSGFLRRGFAPSTFGAAITRPSGKPTLAVTFDDAYASVVDRARPVLAELEVPASLFVPTAHAGDGSRMCWPGIDRWVGTPWEPELTGASWDQLREVAAAGWEIGSHTRSHPRLTGLTDAELRAELEGSRADCEHELDRPCRSIAFPYGDVDARVAAAARAAGYTAGGSLADQPDGAGARPDPLRWPRVGAYRPDSERKVRTKATLLLRAPRLWAMGQATRRRARALTGGRG
jgi:peptidoglycan/xylan/chitin deacetylase (PgdA/CDA1 family)